MLPMIAMFLHVASVIIIVDAVLSWVQSTESFPRSLTTQLTAPLYAPIRGVIGTPGGLDLSPLIVLVIINFIANAL